MMRNSTCTINNLSLIIALNLLLPSFSVVHSQDLPDYWGHLKKGPYQVGFKNACIFDKSRKYDLTFGDSSIVLKNKNSGRPILINMWYPAEKANNTQSLIVKDFFNFPINENSNYFFEKLKKYQLENSKVYSTDFNIRKSNVESDTAMLKKIREQSFENYLSLKTISHKNSKVLTGDYPVIIYHQGLGGTIDENFLLIEYLVSNGYIVINSAFQRSDATWTIGVGDQKATFDDFNFIINYCKQNNISRSKKTFLMGHSYGANSSVAYLGEGHANITGIIPLDSDLGYALYSFYPSAYNPFVKDKLAFYNVPILCISRSEAHFKMADSLARSERYYLTIAGMKHNDFTSQGAIGRYTAIPYVKEKDIYRQVHKNYLDMCTVIIKFLDNYSKKAPKLNKNSINLHDGWVFNAVSPDQKLPYNAPFDKLLSNCPTNSQLLDIIDKEGLESAKKINKPCIDSLFKEGDNVTNIFEAMYATYGTDAAIHYLAWMKEIGFIKNKLRPLFFAIASNSIFDRGNGYHYTYGEKMYKWMAENYPDNEYGAMGMVLISRYITVDGISNYYKKVVDIDPNYKKRKGKPFEEDQFIQIMDMYIKK